MCGTVSKVYFVTPKGFKTAYVVFEKESDLEKALEISEDYLITLNKEKKICFTGVESKLSKHLCMDLLDISLCKILLIHFYKFNRMVLKL